MLRNLVKFKFLSTNPKTSPALKGLITYKNHCIHLLLLKYPFARIISRYCINFYPFTYSKIIYTLKGKTTSGKSDEILAKWRLFSPIMYFRFFTIDLFMKKDVRRLFGFAFHLNRYQSFGKCNAFWSIGVPRWFEWKNRLEFLDKYNICNKMVY